MSESLRGVVGPLGRAQLDRIIAHLRRLAEHVTVPTHGFKTTRRERDTGDIEYQITAEYAEDVRQIAFVSSTRHDAEFIAAVLAQAPLLAALLVVGEAQIPDQQMNTDYRVIHSSEIADDPAAFAGDYVPLADIPNDGPGFAAGRFLLNAYGRRCYDAGYESARKVVVGEAPQEEDVDITIGGAPWTDEQLAGMRALAHEHDLRNARRLLEDAGYQVVEPGTEVGVGDPGRAAVPSPETVTRLEVIDESGHVLHRRPCQIELSYQDAGRTLKLFVKQRAGVPPLQEPAP